MEVRKRSRRNNGGVKVRRRIRAWMSMMLTAAMIVGNMAVSVNTVLASAPIAREEFRIRAAAIQKAAEKVLDEGEAITEEIFIDGKDKSVQKAYQEMFKADGRLYELDLFTAIETVKDVEGITLRVFMRIPQDADPKTHVLTGDEEFYFLYVNDGSESVTARLNIEGLLSGFCTVRPYDAVFGENDKTEDENIKADGKTDVSGVHGENNETSAEQEAGEAGEETQGEKAESKEDKENVGTEKEEGKEETEDNENVSGGNSSGSAGNHLEDEDSNSENADFENESSDSFENADSESESESAGSTEKPHDEDSSSKGDGKADSENNSLENVENVDSKDGSEKTDDKDESADGIEKTDDKGESTDGSGKADDEDNRSDDAGNVNREDKGSGDAEKTEGEDSRTDEVGKAENSERTDTTGNAGNTDSSEKTSSTENSSSAEGKDNSSKTKNNDTDHEKNKTQACNNLGISLHQILRVAEPDSMAGESEDETKAEFSGEDEVGEDETGKDETEKNEEDADADYDEDIVLADEDIIEAESGNSGEKNPFEKRGVLKGKMYNLVTLEHGLTARVFATSLKNLGMSREDLSEGGHLLTYTVSPVGSAVVVHAPELVRDEAEVIFGVIPQVGYRISEVMVNGEELERVSGENLASSSNAKKVLASASNGEKAEGYDENEAAYFIIPSVLESQEIEIVMVEEAEGLHPEFKESMTMSDGITITVSAEEGILPEGTYLQVEEVTDKVADAVKENVEAEKNTTVNTVIAYDINLMLDGRKLSNNYWSGNYVKVEFSGEKIKEISQNSEQVTIAPLETPTTIIAAALGENEEISLLENITADNIQVKMDECQIVQELDNEDVSSFSIDAEHFTVYVIVGDTQNETITVNDGWIALYGDAKKPDAPSYYDPIMVDGKNYYWNIFADRIIFQVPDDKSQEINIKEAKLVLADGTIYEGNILGVYHSSGNKVEKFKVEANGEITVFVDPGMGNKGEIPYSVIGGQLRWIIDGNVSQKYDLYFYALLPDVQLEDADQEYDPDKNWYGIGLGYISGVKSPEDSYHEMTSQDLQRLEITHQADDVTMPEERGKETYPSGFTKEPYPDIPITIDGTTKTYRYAGNITGKESENIGIYTINWLRTVISAGANVGANKYFDHVKETEKIYHRDGQLQLSDNANCTVNFFIRQPGAEKGEFELQEGFTKIVKIGSNETTLAIPETPNKTIGGEEYVFSGWYKNPEWNENEEIKEPNWTTKATFTEHIPGNTTYYGEYIPLPSKTIQIVKTLDALKEDIDDEIDKVNFRLIRTNENGEPGAVVIAINSEIKDGKKIFSFPVYESDFSNDKKAYYMLEELETADGYQKLEGQYKFFVEKAAGGNNLEITLVDTHKDISLEPNKKDIIQIVNYPVEEAGAILPDTGGPGLAMFERFGWFLLMIALLMAGVEVRVYNERKFRKAAVIQGEKTEELL